MLIACMVRYFKWEFDLEIAERRCQTTELGNLLAKLAAKYVLSWRGFFLYYVLYIKHSSLKQGCTFNDNFILMNMFLSKISI